MSLTLPLQRWLLPLTCTLLLAACGETPVRELAGANGSHADFSGAWELDYSQSDNLQEELGSLMREVRREAERRARAQGDNRGGPAPSGGNANGVISLAQLAEYVTQSQLLDITQSDHDIRIKREEDFALSCEFYGDESQQVDNPLGREICGWDGHQLVFWLLLPDGLRVKHRLSLGPQGKRLNIATSVYSRQSSYPFTLDRVYNRYDPESGGIRCKQTLTRGRVCTTEKP